MKRLAIASIIMVVLLTTLLIPSAFTEPNPVPGEGNTVWSGGVTTSSARRGVFCNMTVPKTSGGWRSNKVYIASNASNYVSIGWSFNYWNPQPDYPANLRWEVVVNGSLYSGDTAILSRGGRYRFGLKAKEGSPNCWEYFLNGSKLREQYSTFTCGQVGAEAVRVYSSGISNASDFTAIQLYRNDGNGWWWAGGDLSNTYSCDYVYNKVTWGVSYGAAQVGWLKVR